ncbi:MAG: sugar ABC transporter permease [Clostridiales bacterium]|nr:sugar ABC transporter permease [Clostridiales bacterium]
MRKFNSASIKRDWKWNWPLYVMMIPAVVFYIMFAYIPMFGNIMAFKEFVPGVGIQGFFIGEWVGLKYFKQFIEGIYFWRLIRNTVLISLYNLIFSFPAPIILAILLSELPFKGYKRVVQTITYLPHFVSTVVICGLIVNFSLSTGLFNDFIELFGGSRVPLLQDPKYFRTIYVASGIWQGIGWGSIIYLSAIAGIDASLYEAAVIDGANKFQQIINITIPSIMSTIIIMFILQIGQMMNVGSEKIMLLYNPSIYETSDVISTYVYRIGLVQMNWSFSAAVDLFNKVINFILLITANDISKRVSEVSLM